MGTRRSFLKDLTLTSGSIGLMSAGLITASEKDLQAPINILKKRSLRIAHITDAHMFENSLSIEYFSKAIRQINNMKDKPDMIINSGDTVMNMNEETYEAVQKQWSAWDKCMALNTLPIYSCIGNHDVWYTKPDEETEEIKSNPLYQKQWVIDKLKMPARYYSFTKGKWTFIALDSINRNENGYMFDEEQIDWLNKELTAAASKHVCIFSHVPIMSFTPFMSLLQNSAKQVEDIKFPGYMIHTDIVKMKDIFRKMKNVRLAFSGHIHFVDGVQYHDTRYICGGAICSNWWNGILGDFPHAYGIADLYEDGSFDHRIVHYNQSS